jgi:hypothetical protein
VPGGRGHPTDSFQAFPQRRSMHAQG